MAFKVANTVVINDAGTITGLANGFNVNNKLVFNDTRVFQGTVSGYVSGGQDNVPGVKIDTIQKFPFAADAPSSDVGELTLDRERAGGQSSDTHGYTSGGERSGSYSSDIDKFPFTSDSAASDVGELICNTYRTTGHSASIPGLGYISGGANTPSIVETDQIEKFPFSSDTNALDVGELTVGRFILGGHSSVTHGYSSGGGDSCGVGSNLCNTIDKFPFTSDSPASDVGDLNGCARFVGAGQSSSENGYISGGCVDPNANVNGIQKFPFASDTNASSVGNLTASRRTGSGQSSTTFGYMSGGTENPGRVDTIDKYPFSSDTNASDVGELLTVVRAAAGQQV